MRGAEELPDSDEARRKLTQPLGGCGSVAAMLAQDVAAAYFLSTTVTDPVPTSADAVSQLIPGVPLLAACGLLTLARIMRVGARTQDDLAGTV